MGYTEPNLPDCETRLQFDASLSIKATRYDRNHNLCLELRFFHVGLRGFFTGCGLRQQMHLEIFNASMDLFLINCIIFKVTKTFHTGLMNNLILL